MTADILPKIMDKLKKSVEEMQPKLSTKKQKKDDPLLLLESWVTKAIQTIRENIKNDDLIAKVLKASVKAFKQNPLQINTDLPGEPQEESKEGETTPATPKMTSEEKLVDIVVNFNEKLKHIKLDWDSNMTICQAKIDELQNLQ